MEKLIIQSDGIEYKAEKLNDFIINIDVNNFQLHLLNRLLLKRKEELEGAKKFLAGKIESEIGKELTPELLEKLCSESIHEMGTGKRNYPIEVEEIAIEMVGINSELEEVERLLFLISAFV